MDRDSFNAERTVLNSVERTTCLNPNAERTAVETNTRRNLNILDNLIKCNRLPKIKMLFLLICMLVLGYSSLFAQNLPGAGTPSNPYKIGSLSDWNEFAIYIPQYTLWCIELTADIGSPSDPVTIMVGDGNLNKPFRGVFDGNGYTIYVQLEYNYPSIALFPYLQNYEKEVVIKNLNVVGSVVGTASGLGIPVLGGIIGKIEHSPRVLIENCTSYVNVSTLDVDAYSAGMVGYIEAEPNAKFNTFITISNCANFGNISDSYCNGGICGYFFYDPNKTFGGRNPLKTDFLEIVNCTNYASVEGNSF